MTLDPKKLDGINKQIKELSDLLQKKPKIFGEGELEEAKTYLSGLSSELREMSSDLDYIHKSFKDSVNELSRQNTYLASARKSLSSISDVSQKILSFRKGETQLSSSEINKLKQKAKLQFDEMEIAKKMGSLSTIQKEEIDKALESQDDFFDSIDQTVKAQKQANKELGLSGQLIDGMGKMLGKMGFEGFSKSLSEGIQKTKEARFQMNLNNQSIKENEKELKELTNNGKKRVKDLTKEEKKRRDELLGTNKILKEENKHLDTQTNKYKNILSSLKQQFSYANLLDSAIIQLVAALKSTDSGAGDMAKKMNMTYSEALNVRRELGNMAAMSGDVAVNTKGLQESYIAIGQSLGSNARASDATLIAFTKLREQAGYTNEQLAELNKLSAINSKGLEQNTKDILGGAKAYASRKGLVLNEKQILDDVVKASASLKLSLGGSGDALAKAAVQARSVGLNLETAAGMANQLLQFESSIENELSAELLTGKDLNFEKARQLALNNDIAGAAEEIANQVGTSADFAEMNAIQQEAIAKAAGMTKDQLAQSLMDREALAKLSGVEGADAKEKFNNLVKQVGMEEAKKRLGDEQLANQYQQQSVQERFTQAVEKLKEVFIQIAEPILAIVSPLMNLVGSVLPMINILMQPIIWAAQLLADSFGYVFELISSSTPALITFGTVLSGILITQQAIAFKKKEGWMYSIYEYAMKQKDLALTGIIAVKEAFLGGTKKKNFLMGLADAAMTAFKSVAVIPVIGPILGAAAAAAAVGLGYSLLKGNDIMSPGDGSSGYGKRTLFGPEGAIQLNNKDTVIAGTDLFKKGDDVMSAPKGAITVANSTAPKKEKSVDPSAGTNARLDALIAATGKVNAIPTLKIQ